MRFVHTRPSHSIQILLLLVLVACTPGPDSASAPGITMAPATPMSIAVGDVDTVTGTVTGVAPGVTYTSSNPVVATVNGASGEVTAVAPGSATITAIATANPAVTSSITVTVVTMLALTHSDSLAGFIGEVCPNEEESLLDSLNIDADVPMIHEFHDCQRLSQNNEYRSLVGIFAHRNVDKYKKPEDFQQGRVAALIINFKTKNRWEPYEPLGLAPGVNCLVVRWQKTQPGNRHATEGWEAAVLPRPGTTSSYGDCPNNLTWDSVPEARKRLLHMIPQRNAGTPSGGKIAPPVARWDWDSARTVNTMGVRCGERGWCEVGQAGFKPLAALKTTAGRDIIKGFYDEQYLADSTGARSNVWGTVRPGADAIVAGKIKRDTTWYEAAVIDMEAPEPESPAFRFYTSRLFMPVVVNSATNMRHGTGVMKIMSTALGTRPNKNWNVRVNNQPVGPNGEMTYRDHPNEGHNRFATVRWRWLDNDETVWSYCPEVGCCEMGRLH